MSPRSRLTQAGDEILLDADGAVAFASATVRPTRTGRMGKVAVALRTHALGPAEAEEAGQVRSRDRPIARDAAVAIIPLSGF